MSLTSYRAAPPRVEGCGGSRQERARKRRSGARGRRHGTNEEGRGIVLGRSGNDLLSRVLRHSTIGAEEFNGRVRDGIGFRLLAQITGPAKDNGKPLEEAEIPGQGREPKRSGPSSWSRARTIRAIKPIERLVPVSSTRCRACTPGLSTWSSSTALKGILVSRWVSRLDAFSGYPVRT
jgi:hypothetical protein